MNNSLDAFPVEYAHLEELANLQSEPNSETVAEQHVENDGIPPAFGKVWQQMSEDNLKFLASASTANTI